VQALAKSNGVMSHGAGAAIMGEREIADR